ncbi:DNA starvation/stationary phase protection protein [Planococcus sp. ISL-109]|uniref:Dps family protein n=1 Tax=Planococcus sp. ISL-109 TaxID=2819166 RepID=UPI001BEA1919|nr:DNA starvation/stationary phase protection protein [Planococcus sp. ISL-109]
MKLHQFHWYLKGPEFFLLHEKFNKLYEEANEYYDAFGERLVAVGEKPYSILGEHLEHAFISEESYTEPLSSRDMLGILVNDYRIIWDVTVKAIHLAAKEKEDVTVDMLTGYKASLDNNIWMLQAYLRKAALEVEEDEE